MSRKRPGGLPMRSPSLESTASQSLAPSPRVGRVADKAQGGPLSSYGSHLYDCCALLIYCPKHKNFGLQRISPSKGLFLPYVQLRTSEGWYTGVLSKLKQLLSMGPGSKNFLSFSPPEMIHILRLQVPNVCKFVSRVAYSTQLTHDEKQPTNCCQPGKLTWISANDISQNKPSELWGPEVFVFGDATLNGNIDKGAYTEFTLREAYRYSPREKPKTYQEELVKSANLQEKDITKIYSEFIQHAYPSQYFVFYSFSEYMTKMGWSSSDMDLASTFRAFIFHNQTYISFNEFLLGISAMDKNTPHGGHPGELRCGYIFRYYNTSGGDFMDPSDMTKLVYDILRLKNKPCDADAVEEEMKKNYAMLKIAPNEQISKDQLARGIGTMAFRGSSALFRCSFSVIAAMNLKKVYDSVSQLQSNTTLDAGGRRTKGTCARCRAKKYTLAVHSVRVAPDGTTIEPVEINQENVQQMPKEKRIMSAFAFNSENIANRLLDWIRDFAIFANLDVRSKTRGKKAKSGQNFWMSSDRASLAAIVLKLCAEAEATFRRETRCVKLNSPCYVFGDIHGNLHDLLIYEKVLWEKGPMCTASSYLFLGDYVDRGDNGLECVLYLLACKVLSPDKYYMLRGNHELRPIQTVFTFQRECLEKFGRASGQAVWEACNRVFDCLPVCAAIDDSIFCAHGGIPSSATKVDEINNIPVVLPDPENQSPAAWEMLWNDPVTANEYAEYSEMLRLQSGSVVISNLQGFLPNTKRGTAFYFGDLAVSKFLSANGFSHIIRAHEVIPPGYNFHAGGKVITVFSSSRYCGGVNEAACIFIDDEKLRIMRMDTSD